MPVNPPQTAVRTSHAITLKTDKGITIGLIKQWNPSQNRDINPIYELNVETSGDPLENVPGNVRNLKIKVTRYDLFTTKMEEAFGTSELVFLSDQDRPFTVQEIWRKPDGSSEGWQYSGCWFENIGKNYSSDDQRMVLVDASLAYVRRTKIGG
jgi:hypothetical protein